MRGQIGHTFRKDVRHHWPELAVALAILATYVWVQPKQWMPEEFQPQIEFLAGLVAPLVPIAWAFLIVRLVHDESLVGDRQFWVTRPYDWKRLLVQKLLFVLLFVNVPLFIADVVLLRMAGFKPMPYLSELLWLQLMWILILVLPAMTLATITSSVTQAVLIVLGSILSFVAGGVLASDSSSALPQTQSIPSSIELMVVVAAAVAVVIWQYARRKTLRARVLLVSGILTAVFVVPMATPYGSLIARNYPPVSTGQALPVQLAFDSQTHEQQAGGSRDKKKVSIGIPLLFSGLTQGSIVSIDGTDLTLDAPGGQHWSSGWHSGGSFLLPNRQHVQAYFQVDRDFFERVKTTPIRAHISIALAEFRETDAKRIVIQAGRFAVPGDGRCSPVRGDFIRCLFPLKEPFTLISAQSEEITCTPQQNEAPLPAGITGYGWMGNRNASPADFGISSVHVRPLYVSDWGKLNDRYLRARVCPGTPLTFHALEEVRGTQTAIQIDGIRLADYALKNLEDGASGLGLYWSVQ